MAGKGQALDDDPRTAFCPTCNRRAWLPTRVYDSRGKVMAGCIDGFHDGQLTTPSESARWHSRPTAKAIRRDGEISRRYGYDRSRWPERYRRRDGLISMREK